MTSTMTADIEVDAPIRAVYDQWTQFEEFPEFMGSVNSITQTTDEGVITVNTGNGVSEFGAFNVESFSSDQVTTGDVQTITNGREIV